MLLIVVDDAFRLVGDGRRLPESVFDRDRSDVAGLRAVGIMLFGNGCPV